MEKKYRELVILYEALSIVSIIIAIFAELAYRINENITSLMLSLISMICFCIFGMLYNKYKKKYKELIEPYLKEQPNIDSEEEAKKALELQEEIYRKSIKMSHDKINTSLLNIGVKNKEFLEDTLGETVAKYLKAINNQNEKEIKSLCSEEIAQRTIKSINENDKLGVDLKVEDINIISSTITDVIPIKKDPLIETKIIVMIKESIVKENENSQNNKTDLKVYKVEFNKKSPKKPKDYQCDNCGAELSALTDICPYCRTNPKFVEERNWFIFSIEEDN